MSPTLYHGTKKRMQLYKELRKAMLDFELTQEDIAKILDRSPEYANRRFNGQRDWTMADAYTITKAVNRPVTDLLTLFPEGGRS